jgi:glucokinase
MRIGIDIGATTIKAGTVVAGQLKKHSTLPSGQDQHTFLDNLVELIRDCLGGHVLGIGIGCPGPADYPHGLILKTPNLPVQNFNLKHYLKQFFKTEIVMENDAVCFALGEALFGAGKGHKKVVTVTLGTGVGGGIVIDGSPYRGMGNAGHFSQMVINDKRVKHRFFSYESFEVLCNEQGLLARAPGFASGLEMCKAAQAGNTQALKAFSEYGHSLGLALGSLIACLDPEVVVVGGGLSKAWAFFESEMRSTISEVTYFKARVVCSGLEHGAILGAASLVKG